MTELRCKDNVESVLWKSIKILNFGLDTCTILLKLVSSVSNEKMTTSRITFFIKQASDDVISYQPIFSEFNLKRVEGS